MDWEPMGGGQVVGQLSLASSAPLPPPLPHNECPCPCTSHHSRLYLPKKSSLALTTYLLYNLRKRQKIDTVSCKEGTGENQPIKAEDFEKLAGRSRGIYRIYTSN